MSSSTFSDIFQNNTEMLEKQQSLLWLQKAVEVCHAERVAQKARREVEAKAKEETKKWRIVEKKKKLEYIQ